MAIVVDIGDGVTAKYHGGEYIDLCFGDRAFEVINVWNYETSTPRIPRSVNKVREEGKAWLRENRETLPDYRMSVGL